MTHFERVHYELISSLNAYGLFSYLSKHFDPYISTSVRLPLHSLFHPIPLGFVSHYNVGFYFHFSLSNPLTFVFEPNLNKSSQESCKFRLWKRFNRVPHSFILNKSNSENSNRCLNSVCTEIFYLFILSL